MRSCMQKVHQRDIRNIISEYIYIRKLIPRRSTDVVKDSPAELPEEKEADSTETISDPGY